MNLVMNRTFYKKTDTLEHSFFPLSFIKNKYKFRAKYITTAIQNTNYHYTSRIYIPTNDIITKFHILFVINLTNEKDYKLFHFHYTCTIINFSTKTGEYIYNCYCDNYPAPFFMCEQKTGGGGGVIFFSHDNNFF